MSGTEQNPDGQKQESSKKIELAQKLKDSFRAGEKADALLKRGSEFLAEFKNADFKADDVLTSIKESYEENQAKLKQNDPGMTLDKFIMSYGKDMVRLCQIKLNEFNGRYDLGKYGPAGDGVDGILGKRTHAALEAYFNPTAAVDTTSPDLPAAAAASTPSALPVTQSGAAQPIESTTETRVAGWIETDDNKSHEIEAAISKLETKFGLKDEMAIIVNPRVQELYLIKGRKVIKTYNVSTGKNGLGNVIGSYQTPPGTHRIGVKALPDGRHKGITGRILTLEGQEPGINNGGAIDSHTRGILIHGTNREDLIGTAASQGCVRLTNADVKELYEIVPPGTLMEIINKEWQPAAGSTQKSAVT